MMTPETATPAPKRVNLRTPDVMAAVQAQVEGHYRSEIVEKLRASGGTLSRGGVTVKLAKQFGFCYGVERAIDLAYAARKVFREQRVFILGEIIHNPEVNEQIRAMGIQNLLGKNREAEVDDLSAEDVVLVPAFGTDVQTLARIKERGCQIVDTTCGDVMSVWKRVRQNAQDDMTSIIHGKASHEETKATASRAVKDGRGHYLVVLSLAETDYVCDYIRRGGDKAAFLEKFAGAYSDGFDPDQHLKRVGVANQTTMMRGETEEVQRRIAAAIRDRDAAAGQPDAQVARNAAIVTKAQPGDGTGIARSGGENFRFFDTICGATQERQDALRDMLEARDTPMNLLIVVGGYNSSNTSHLAEMGEHELPTFFIRNASRLESREKIVHYNQHEKREVATEHWLPERPLTVGITAGASCPNNLIEETILRLFELHGISREELLAE